MQINEHIITNRKYRELTTIHQRWEMTPKDISYIEEKYKHNEVMKKLIRKKPIIIKRKRENTMDDFVITKKYRNFKGRIITEEHILHNDTEIPIMAEWDTGATYSCISTNLAEKLGLQPIKAAVLDTSSERIKTDVFTVNLLLGKDVVISVDVSAVDNIDDKGINFLIGMDIITFGDFALSTCNGITCFSFRIPSHGLIDFGEI